MRGEHIVGAEFLGDLLGSLGRESLGLVEGGQFFEFGTGLLV